MKHQIVVKKSLETVAIINGIIDVDPDYITGTDLRNIIPTEQFLERLTGLRWHINIVESHKVTPIPIRKEQKDEDA